VKRTRKWSFVAQEATRLASIGLTPKEIATRLGVDRSTVVRWMQAGKIQRTGGPKRVPKRRGKPVSRTGQTPAQWAAAVRKEYSLDSTDDQLVTLAESALLLSRDPGAAAPVRLVAAGRFQALVKQLALVARNADAVPEPKPAEEPQKRQLIRVVTRSSGADPRAALMVANAK